MYLKKSSVIVTLILITVFSTASFFIYFGYLSSYQKAYQNYIKTNKLNLVTQTIAINPSALYINTKHLIWEDDNKEVVVDGILYDIISITLNNGKVELTVLSDTKEQAIKQQFATNFDVSNIKSTNTPLKLLKQFLALKFLNTSNEVTAIATTQLNNLVFCNYNFYITLQTILPELLPPIFVA